MDLSPDDLKKAIQNAIVAVEKQAKNIMMNAANVGASEMQFRVFNKGVATSGKKMMYRSAPYKKLRKDAGLQINHKDLTFTGNLFNSLTMVTADDKKVSYGFNNAEMNQIRTYQETSSKQVNEPIFNLSKKEIKMVENALEGGVGRIVISTIENYPNMPTFDVEVKPVPKKTTKSKTKAKPKAKKKNTPKPKTKKRK